MHLASYFCILNSVSFCLKVYKHNCKLYFCTQLKCPASKSILLLKGLLNVLVIFSLWQICSSFFMPISLFSSSLFLTYFLHSPSFCYLNGYSVKHLSVFRLPNQLFFFLITQISCFYVWRKIILIILLWKDG